MSEVQTTYVEKNEYGSAVIAGTRIHVSAVGFAHEGGFSEDEIMDRFNLNHETYHGVLAYFYKHRDEILAREAAAEKKALELSKDSRQKLNEWRSRSADTDE